jgi:hypothetical protein
VGLLSPRKPVRADHRYLSKMLDVLLEDKVEHRASEYTALSRVFLDYGGSWERLLGGSIADIVKLKEVISFAYENGHLTKKEKWI